MAELRTRYGMGDRVLPAKGAGSNGAGGSQATSAVYEEPLTLQTALEAAEQQAEGHTEPHAISTTPDSASVSDQPTLTSSPERGRVIVSSGLGRSKRSRPVIPPRLEKQASFEL